MSLKVKCAEKARIITLKDLEISLIVANRNYIHDNAQNKLNSFNFCCHSIQNLSFILSPRNKYTKIYQKKYINR
jgi:hypothetical protein